MVVLTLFDPPTEGVVRQESNCKAFVGSNDFGLGTLYIAESRVSWVGADSKGFSLEYPAISIHAISRDMTAFPYQCLYLMLNGDLEEKDHSADSSSATEEGQHSRNSNGGDEDDDDDDGGGDDNEDEKITEIRFVPQDVTTLDVMFAAMSDCQILHPDEQDFDEEFDDGQDTMEQGDGDIELEMTPQGQATLERLEAMLQAGQTENAQTTGTLGEGDSEEMDAQFEDAEQPDH